MEGGNIRKFRQGVGITTDLNFSVLLLRECGIDLRLHDRGRQDPLSKPVREPLNLVIERSDLRSSRSIFGWLSLSRVSDAS